LSYHGALPRIRSGGGHKRVTLSSGVGQGNDGTSLGCAGCWVQPAIANTAVVRWNIGVAASATVGQDLARPYIYDGTDEASATTAPPFWVPVSDISLLYFYSSDEDAIVDLIYLKG